MGAEFTIIAMDKIKIIVFRKSFKKWPLHMPECVPTHVGNNIESRKFNYPGVKNSQTGCLSFLRKFTHQLQAKANAQKRLNQRRNDQIQPCFFQKLHGGRSLAYPGKYNFTCPSYCSWVISYYTIVAKSFHCIFY